MKGLKAVAMLLYFVMYKQSIADLTKPAMIATFVSDLLSMHMAAIDLTAIKGSGRTKTCD